MFFKVLKGIFKGDIKRYLSLFPIVMMLRLSRFELIRDIYAVVFCRPSTNFDDYYLDTALKGGSVKKIISDNSPLTILSQINKNSYYVGLTLKPEVVREIQAYANANLCFGNLSPKNGFLYHEKEMIFSTLPKPFVAANYFNASTECKALKDLHLDQTILEIVAGFLGKRAIHIATNLTWSFAGDFDDSTRNYFSQKFHTDTDDWRFLKFFWYLTDVDLLSGPHLVVSGTHRGKLLSHQKSAGRYSDEIIFSSYKNSPIVSISGKAGTGFVEDTTAYHKGQPPEKRDRLMLCIQFAINDWKVNSDILPADQLLRINEVV